jgi:hypothetical protein
MSLFYTIYTLILNPEREYLAVFKESAINTSLVLLLPYSAIHLLFLVQRKRTIAEDAGERTSQCRCTTKRLLVLRREERTPPLRQTDEPALYRVGGQLRMHLVSEQGQPHQVHASETR